MDIDRHVDRKRTSDQSDINNSNSSPYWKAVDKLRRSIEQSNAEKVNKSERKVYRSVDDFLSFIKGKGIPTKDNRRNDGCVWVRADVEIADLMACVLIDGRGFRYASKCKAFNGEPGWFY